MDAFRQMEDGALAKLIWQFVPPKPKELTPAILGGSLSFQTSGSVGTKNGVLSKEILGFRFSKWRLGGISLRRKASITLIKPAMPAAASRWPIFVLTDPIAHLRSGARVSISAFLIDSASIGSPTGVPVPWASR